MPSQVIVGDHGRDPPRVDIFLQFGDPEHRVTDLNRLGGLAGVVRHARGEPERAVVTQYVAGWQLTSRRRADFFISRSPFETPNLPPVFLPDDSLTQRIVQVFN